MKRLAIAALAAALALAPFAGDALADNGRGSHGRGHGGRGAEQAANPNQDRPGRPEGEAHARGGRHAGEAHNRGRGHAGEGHPRGGRHADDDRGEQRHEDGEEHDRIGVCHATGNGSYVFIRVSENARGHLEHHEDDIVNRDGADDCPDSVADDD